MATPNMKIGTGASGIAILNDIADLVRNMEKYQWFSARLLSSKHQKE